MEVELTRAFPLVRVERREGRGRCLVAARDIPAGTLVFSNRAAAAFPASDGRCMRCWVTSPASGGALLRCTNCKSPYCCAACQKSDWRASHRHECKPLRGFKSKDSNVPPAIWVPLLLAARLYRNAGAPGGDDSEGASATAPTPFSASLADAQSLIAPPAPENGSSFSRARTIAALGRTLELFPVDVTDARATADQLSFDANNFSLTDETLDIAGFGCYPAAALLNHSCAPSVVLSYGFAVGAPAEEATTLFCRTLVHVREGEELTHSYVDATKPVDTRRSELRLQYGFVCDCSACVKEASSSEAAAADASGGASTDEAARGRLMISQSRSLATEPDLPMTVSLLDAMRTEEPWPEAVPVPVAVAQNWKTDPAFPRFVGQLDLAVIIHGVRLLRRSLPPFHTDVMQGVHAAMSAALQMQNWVIAEAAARHLLADLRTRATFAHSVDDAGSGPAAPLYALQLVPVADIYAAWARQLEIAAAAETPGLGQAIAKGARVALPPVALSADLLESRVRAATAFFAPPSTASCAAPLSVDQESISTKDFRAAAARLYERAATCIELSFGAHSPYAKKQRSAAHAMTG